VACALAAILFCGLFPFDLSIRDIGTQLSRRFDWSFAQFFTSGDTIENILFFMPLGFALGALLVTRPDKNVQAGIISVIISFCVSASWKSFRAFLPNAILR